MKSIKTPLYKKQNKYSYKNILNIPNSQSTNKKNILKKNSKIYQKTTSKPKTFNNLNNIQQQILIKNTSIKNISQHHNTYKSYYSNQKPKSNYLLKTNNL